MAIFAYMKKSNIKLFKLQAKIAKALSHESRLIIINALKDKEMCVCELTKLIGTDQSTVSRHLAVLKNAGILTEDRKGNKVYYKLLTPCVLDFFECAIGVIKAHQLEQIEEIV